MSEPLPCPFCGFPPDISRDNKVFCGEGSCPTQPMTGDRMTRDEAIERWNTRAPDPREGELWQAIDDAMAADPENRWAALERIEAAAYKLRT